MVAYQAHNLRGWVQFPHLQLKSKKMEKKIKKLDVITGPLSSVIEELNKLSIPKEDIVSIFQNKEGSYVATFYY